MSVYVGDEKAHIYHGDHHPAELWGPDPKGNKLVRYASFDIPKVSGQGRVELGEQPYKAALPSVIVKGEGKQDKLEGNNLFDPKVLTDRTDHYKGAYVIRGNKLTIKYADYQPWDGVSTALIFSGGDYFVMPGANSRVQIKPGTNADRIVIYKSEVVHLDPGTYKFKVLVDTFPTDTTLPFICKGTQPLPYEPYCGGIPAPNPDHPIDPVFLEGASITDGTNAAPLPILRAFDNYTEKDSIDIASGIINRIVGYHEFTGDEKITTTWGAQWNTFVVIQDAKRSKYDYPDSTGVYSNFYAPTSHSNMYGKISDLCITRQVERTNVLIRDTRFDTEEAFKAYLKEQYASGHPLRVWYALETPIIEHYDPAILRQHPGYTQLIQQGGFREAEIEAEYWKEM